MTRSTMKKKIKAIMTAKYKIMTQKMMTMITMNIITNKDLIKVNNLSLSKMMKKFINNL